MEFLDTFHFIRPNWLYALLPSLLLFVWIMLKKQKAVAWSQICDPELLEHFLVEQGAKPTRSPNSLLMIIWLIAIFALAGPSWNKIESPVYTNQNALVIIVDLSQSMNAEDLKPSRLQRTKYKLTDLLKQRDEGQTALIVYAGDAHIVSPLTPDHKTILSFVPILDSSLMPVPGSQLEKALSTAEQLFTNSGITQGNILLFSDGLSPSDRIKNNNSPSARSEENNLQATIKRLNASQYYLSIIGVGTLEGSPIPNEGKTGFIKNSDGNIVVSKLKPTDLQNIASLGGGEYRQLSIGNDDFQFLLKENEKRFQKNLSTETDKTKGDDGLLTDAKWQDMGAWFSLLLIPLVLFSFRQGWLLAVLIIVMPLHSLPAYSAPWDDLEWDNLWIRADQKGSQSFQSGKHEQAAQEFNNSQWKGSSYYKAGKYQQAIEQFSQSDNIDDLYNKANSHAHLKQFKQALSAYDDVLKKQPDHADTLKNKKIIEDLLKKQEQQKKESSSDKNKQQDKDAEEKSESQDGEKKPSDSSDDDKQDGQSPNQDQQQNDNQQQQDENQKRQNEQQKEQQNSKNNKQHEKDKQKEQEALEEQKNNEAQSQQENQASDQESQQQTKAEKESLFDQLNDEEKQAMQQYLNQIEDDPAYLLRRKFYLNSMRSKQNENPEPNSAQPLLNQSNQAKQPW